MLIIVKEHSRAWANPVTGEIRYYINATQIGLELDHDTTGAIAAAWWRGTEITHNEAARLNASKIWFTADGTAHARTNATTLTGTQLARAARDWFEETAVAELLQDIAYL